MNDMYYVKRNPELIDRKVIEDIKADIENIYCGQYCEHIYTADEVRELALEIIDKHCGGDKE